MKLKIILIILGLFVFSGCSTLQRLSNVNSSKAPHSYEISYSDGGISTYYEIDISGGSDEYGLVFFYGGSGCASWKSVMPGYIDGINIPSKVYVLNKRHVSDKSLGIFDCGDDFKLSNNPEQWEKDYIEFINFAISKENRNLGFVVLVGVSEGAIVASKVASQMDGITHLAVIGSGGWAMRDSLRKLQEKGSIPLDIEAEWEEIEKDPRSIEKMKYGHTYRWWADVMNLEPMGNYLSLDIPILIGIGENDKSVPVESAISLDNAFKERHKTNLELIVYPGADHRLNDDNKSYRSEFFGRLSGLLKEST